MAITVFNRYEKKYLLSEEKYELLRKELEPYMEMDSYGLHTICNIYYDTNDSELIRKSIEKPQYKEKLRLRSYGVPQLEDTVFLEIKKKYKGNVNKRRIPIKLDEAYAYLHEGKMPEKDTQIFREIDYLCSRYDLVPKLYLAYERIALFGKEDPGFRVTFDQNIRSRTENPGLEQGDEGKVLLEKGYYLMEVKIATSMPLWFSRILTKLQIYNQSFSKYGTIYTQQQIKEREECLAQY